MTIAALVAGGAVTLLGRPQSPPTFMKNDGLVMTRLVLKAGDGRHARQLLDGRVSQEGCLAEQAAAFYRGIAHMRLGESEQSRRELARARQLGDRQSGGLFTELSLLAGDGAAYVSTSAVGPDHTLSLGAHGDLVAPARTAIAEGANDLESQIRLMSALLVYAELASRGIETAYTNANDAYQEGLDLFAAVESRIAEDPEGIEKRLSDPRNLEVAMRLDAVRARFAIIRDDKAAKSRAAERERISSLQQIVLSYRDFSGRLSAAMTGFALEDFNSVETAVAEGKQLYGQISQLANSERDFHLLTPEPDPTADPDQSIAFVAVAPFTTNLNSQLEIISGMSLYKTAQQSPSPDFTNAIAKIRSGLGAGGDANNPLGHYVLGLALEAQALTRVDPALTARGARAAAAADFDGARKAFQRAVELLSGAAPAGSPAGLVLESARTRLADLSNPQSFATSAASLSRSGRHKEAHDLVIEGLRRHESPELVYAWAETGLRAGRPATELSAGLAAAAGSNSISPQDFRTPLNQAKVLLSKVLSTAAAKPLETLPQPARASLAADASQAEALALQAQQQADGQGAQPLASAYLAFARAMKLVAQAPEQRITPERAQAYELARTSNVKTNELLQATPDDIRLQEAAVVGRLAQGYLSLYMLQDYRDDAVTAFSAALDEMSRIPTTSGANLKILGAPLLQAIQRRPPDADAQLNNERRDMTRSLLSFVDGAVSLQYGATEEAIQRFSEGLQEQQAARRRTTAGEILMGAAGVDLELYFREQLRCYKVLALVKRRESDAAILEAVRLIAPNLAPANAAGADVTRRLTQPALDQLVRDVGSPLAAFALGVALEDRVREWGLAPAPQRASFVTAAAAAYQRANNLFTEDLRRRYSHLVSLTNQGLQRVQSPQSYKTKIRQLLAENKLQTAIEELVEQALPRHASDEELWQILTEAAVVRASIRSGSEAARRQEYEQVLYYLDRMEALAPQNQFLTAFTRGRVHEALEQSNPALRAYERARAAANSEQDRSRASIRISVVRSSALLRSAIGG